MKQRTYGIGGTFVLLTMAGCSVLPTKTAITTETENKENNAVVVADTTNLEQGNTAVVNDLDEENGNNTAITANDNSTLITEGEETEVDTSDPALSEVEGWLTYTNEEYGFSFRYPREWTLKINDAGLVSLTNEMFSIRTKIFVSENVVKTSIDEKTALKFEDGREPLPLVFETFISINGLSSYRAFRQLKKGDPIFTEDELNEITRTEIEYTYLNEDDLFRIWFTIDGENTEPFYDTVDAIGQSFSI